MAKKKTFTAKIKNGIKNVLWILAVLALAFYLMTFDFIAKPVSKLLNTTVEAVKDVAQRGFTITASAILVIAGAVIATVPSLAVLGAIVAVIGATVILVELIGIWNDSGSGTKIDLGRD